MGLQSKKTPVVGALKLGAAPYMVTSTILEQDLRELKNSTFLFAEMGLGQAEQHLSCPPVYTPASVTIFFNVPCIYWWDSETGLSM